MSIPVSCPHCQAAFRVNSEFAGKQGKCPKCQGLLSVPAAADPPSAMPAGVAEAKQPTLPVRQGVPPVKRSAPAAAPATPAASPANAAAVSPAELQRELLAAIQGKIKPVETTLGYKLGLAAVSIVMVLLPLLYVGLIAAFGYLIYLHAIHDKFLLSAGSGRGRGIAAMLYIAPIVAGPIALLFMIKPLFARPAKIERRRSLTADSDPVLFAFVARLCAAVGSPAPRRIDVDSQVNASASFRRGVWSMIVGNDLVLTIGLPLVAGMTLRQFAGVLAHEFGHFSQGLGMRLTYIIRSISFWFMRVVYERDVWDQRLVEWTDVLGGRLAFIFWFARLFVWLTRKVLWVFMMAGHAVAGYLLRQMEFDADRHEARFAGSDVFEESVRTLVMLSAANNGAMQDLGDFYREGRLSDNLPRLIMANVTQFPPEVQEKVTKVIAESRTGWFDTHPCDRDRVASAQREQAPGVFHDPRPATVLFADFDALAKAVTWDYYRGIFGPQLKTEELHPTEDLLRRQGREIAATKALRRFFQDGYSALRPLSLPGGLWGEDGVAEDLAAQVRAARQQMLDQKAAYDEAYKQFDQADTQRIEAEQAVAMMSANFSLKPGVFSVPLTQQSDVRRVREGVERAQKQAEPALAPFESAATARLVAALRLVRAPEVAAKLTDPAAVEAGINQMLPAMRLLNRLLPEILQLRDARAGLQVLVGQIENNRENQKLFEQIVARMETVRGLIYGIYRDLGAEQYPFDHAKGQMTIAAYALEKLPPAEDLGAILSAGDELFDKLQPLVGRMMSQLAWAAEQVETALGLPLLPDPNT